MAESRQPPSPGRRAERVEKRWGGTMVGNGMNLNFQPYFLRRGLHASLAAKVRACAPNRRRAYLIELLLVVVVMAILGTITGSAYVNKVARTKRTKSPAACSRPPRYRSPRQWPIGTFKPNADGYVIVGGKDNAKISSRCARRTSRENAESAIWTNRRSTRSTRLKPVARQDLGRAGAGLTRESQDRTSR